MDFIVKLLFLGGKYISQAAGRTILEIIHRGRSIRNNISIQYEKASEIVKPYDNMLELLNERVREASEDDIHFAYMNHELKMQLEEHMRQLSSISHAHTNALVKNNWQNEDKLLKEEGKDTLLTTETNYDDLENSFTGKDIEYDKMYTDLCKDLIKQSSEVLNNATNINQIHIPTTTQHVSTKEEKSISKALGNLENKIDSSNFEILDIDLKNNEEDEEEESSTFQNIKKYTHMNPNTRNPVSTLYYGDTINMNYLVEQSPTDSYYNTNVINKNMKRHAKNSSDSKEQTPTNCTKPQKKYLKTSGVKLLNTDDIMQVNNKAIIRGLSQEIESRMVLLNKNRECFKIFEKKLHDRIIKNKVNKISKDIDHRSSVLAHNIIQYNKFESKLEKKLKKRINKIVCRKLNSGLNVDSNNGTKQSLKEVVKLLKVNEKEFQKLEEKVTQLLIRQGLENMCFTKINYREIEIPTCKNCLSNSDKEEMQEREKIIEVNRKVFEDFERDMSRIVILDKNKATNKGDSVSKESNEYGININKLRKNISRSYTNRYDILSNVLKNQQNSEDSCYKKNGQKHFSKCSLSSRDRDDIRERASILEINAKAFEMFENKVNKLGPSKTNCNLMISRSLTSMQNNPYQRDNNVNEDELLKTKDAAIVSHETINNTSATKALKKLLDKSLIFKDVKEHHLDEIKDVNNEIKELTDLNSTHGKYQKYQSSDGAQNDYKNLEKLLAEDKMEKLDQNSFEKISDFKPELENDVKNIGSSINNLHLNNSTAQYAGNCLEKSIISVEGDSLANLRNEKAIIKCSEKEKNLLVLNTLESNNVNIQKQEEDIYPNNFETEVCNKENTVLCKDKSTNKVEERPPSKTLSKQIEIDQTEINSKIPQPNYKFHPATATAETQSKSHSGTSTNFQQKPKFGDSTPKLTQKELTKKTVNQPKIPDTKVLPKEDEKYVKNKHFFYKKNLPKSKGIMHAQSVSCFKIVDDQEISKFNLKKKSVINKSDTFKEKCNQSRSNTKSQSTSCLEEYNAISKTKRFEHYDGKHFKPKIWNLRKNKESIKRTEAQTSEKLLKNKILNTNYQKSLPCSKLSRIPNPSVGKLTKYQENNNLNENMSCTKNENSERQFGKNNIQTEMQTMKVIDSDAKNKSTFEIRPKQFQNFEINVIKLEKPNLNNKTCLHGQEKNINLINKMFKQYQHQNTCSNSVFITGKSKFNGDELQYNETIQASKKNKSVITSKIPQLKQTYGFEIMDTDANTLKYKHLQAAAVTESEALSSIQTRNTEKKRELDDSNPLTNGFSIEVKNIIGAKNNEESIKEPSISKRNKQADNNTILNMKTGSVSEIIMNGITSDKAIEISRNSQENRCSKKCKNMCQQKKAPNDKVDEFNIRNYLSSKTTENLNQQTTSNKLVESKQNMIKYENRNVNLSTMSKISQENDANRRNSEHEKEKSELFHTNLVQVIGFDGSNTHSTMNKSHFWIEPTENVKGDTGVISEYRKLDEKPLSRTHNKIDNITFENQKIRPQFRNIHNNHKCSNISFSKTTTSVKDYSNETKVKASDINSKPKGFKAEGINYFNIHKQSTSTSKNSHNSNITRTNKISEDNVLPSNTISDRKNETIKGIRPTVEKTMDKDIIINKQKYCLKKILAYVPVDAQIEYPPIYEQNINAKAPTSNEIQKLKTGEKWIEETISSTSNSSKPFENNTSTKRKRSNHLESNVNIINKAHTEKFSKKNPEKKFCLKSLSQTGADGNSMEKKTKTKNYKNIEKFETDSKQKFRKYIEPSKTEVLLNQIKENIDLDMYYKNFIINYNRNDKLQEISTRELHRHNPNIHPQMEQQIPNLNDEKELSYEIALSKKNTCFAKRLLRKNIPKNFRSMSTNADLLKRANTYKNSSIPKEKYCTINSDNVKVNVLNHENKYSEKKQNDEIKSEILNKNLRSNKTCESTSFPFREAKFAFLPLENTKYMSITHSELNKNENIVQDSEIIESSHISQSMSPLLSYVLRKNSPVINTRKM